MYNKLFSKILDSSIWLEPSETRIVWLMFIAVMDEDGFVQFASVANVAHRARIDLKSAEQAIKCLESEDPNSSDSDNGGRRLERVSGGWMVLNSRKYRDLVTRSIAKEQGRIRVARYRETVRNGGVTESNGSVTTSEAVAIADTESEFTLEDTEASKKKTRSAKASPTSEEFVDSLKKDPTYKGIDVYREYGKCVAWCKVNRKEATHRRFINWLNRAERPLNFIGFDSAPKSALTSEQIIANL